VGKRGQGGGGGGGGGGCVLADNWPRGSVSTGAMQLLAAIRDHCLEFDAPHKAPSATPGLGGQSAQLGEEQLRRPNHKEGSRRHPNDVVSRPG